MDSIIKNETIIENTSTSSDDRENNFRIAIFNKTDIFSKLLPYFLYSCTIRSVSCLRTKGGCSLFLVISVIISIEGNNFFLFIFIAISIAFINDI